MSVKCGNCNKKVNHWWCAPDDTFMCENPKCSWYLKHLKAKRFGIFKKRTLNPNP